MIKTVSQVRVVNVKPHAYKSNVNQAELRQSVVKEYTAQSMGNNMQSSFAPKDSYNLPNSTFQSERVCWVNIPKDWDMKVAEAHINMLQNNGINTPCLYQVLNFEPILTSDDEAHLQTLGEYQKEQFMSTKRKTQMIVNPTTGEIVMRANKTLYRRLFYSDTVKEDIDLAVVKQVSAVEAESATSVSSGQTKTKKTDSVRATVDTAMEF